MMFVFREYCHFNLYEFLHSRDFFNAQLVREKWGLAVVSLFFPSTFSVLKNNFLSDEEEVILNTRKLVSCFSLLKC